jgi:hypothetical protein
MNKLDIFSKLIYPPVSDVKSILGLGLGHGNWSLLLSRYKKFK